MSIIEKIRAEVLRLIRESDGPGSPYGFGKMSACNRILNFLDTLQEQPVCEDVEEAAKAYADYINSNECLYTYTDFYDAFKAGAKWQREQNELSCDGLEEEITSYIKKHYHIRNDETLERGNDALTTYDFAEIARHFYEIGWIHLWETECKGKKEVCVELKDEIERWLKEGAITDTRYDDFDERDIRTTARHFAKWGAEHLKK